MGELCSKPKKLVSTPAQPALLTRMITGNTNFAFLLYSELRKETNKNVFFSPSEISIILSMIYSCAKDNTAAEIKQTSQLTDLEDREIPYAAKQLNVFLKTEKEGSAIFNTSHRLFVTKDRKLTKNIVKETQRFFESPPQLVDFASGIEMSRKEVNNVVDSDTMGRVKNLLQEENNPITQETSVLATSAFYFKGKWQKEFDRDLTEVAKFKTDQGMEVDVDMMYNLLETGYAINNELDCQIIDLPFLKGDLSMFVILPNKDDGLADLESKINSKNLEGLIQETHTRKEHMLLKLPKFSLQNQFSLNKALTSLGMNEAFKAAEANLSKINGTNKLFLSEVQHKTILEVDEKGKPFVAPGEGQMGECSPTERLRIVQITVDHPFLFFIQDNRTYSIHVMGRVVNPS